MTENGNDTYNHSNHLQSQYATEFDGGLVQYSLNGCKCAFEGVGWLACCGSSALCICQFEFDGIVGVISYMRETRAEANGNRGGL